ncbi:hypothetical protein ACRE1S_04405 [Helicobacter himalayensis]|uniref:hypothetical protein n=1 Tax=Helicobacter himalayensis TaxID=1591088 RepID=UPI003D6EFA1E
MGELWDISLALVQSARISPSLANTTNEALHMTKGRDISPLAQYDNEARNIIMRRAIL